MIEVKTKTRQRDELAELEANYYANIQYPPTWIEVSTKGLKQDVNAARRLTCYNHHKWGFQKGYDAGFDACENLMQAEIEELKKDNEKLKSLFSVQLDMVDKIKLLERKLDKAIEQRDRHLEDYLMPDSQKEFFDIELEAIK